MNLYIQIKDGTAYQHPILEDNLRQAFPTMDLENLPANFARFKRYAQPSPTEMPVGTFQVAVVAYEWNEEEQCYYDAWSVREMTEQERTLTTRNQVNENAKRLQDLQEHVLEMIDETEGELQNGWRNYQNLLNSIDFTDPFSVAWPYAPYTDEDGNVVDARV
jgi:hypothetical protein